MGYTIEMQKRIHFYNDSPILTEVRFDEFYFVYDKLLPLLATIPMQSLGLEEIIIHVSVYG